MNELEQLKEIISGMSELIEYWFEGYRASEMGADGIPVYEMSDDYRNRAYKIIEKLMEKERE